MSVAITQPLTTCFAALECFGRRVKAGISFTGDAICASYNMLGQHTFPQAEFRQAPNPKKLAELNASGLVLLTIVPVLPITILLSTTLIPFIANSYQAHNTIFTKLVNLPLRDHQKLPTKDSNRSLLRQLYGLPGFMLGTFTAIPVLTTIVITRVLQESFRSLEALSGSLLNVAFERPIFSGVGSDHRHSRAKAAGCLGYITALLTVAPIALATFALRKIPTLILQTTAVLAFPLVCAAKIPALFAAKSRPPHDPIVQKLHNLKASLNIRGHFIPGQQIVADGSVNENCGTFLRKCFTFNVNTLTENIIAKFLTEYQAFSQLKSDNTSLNKLVCQHASGPNLHLTILADQVKRQVTQHYNHNVYAHCCRAPNEVRNLKMEIQHIVNFILDYLKADLENTFLPVPQKIYTQKSWFLTFRGATDMDKKEKDNPYLYERIPSVSI